MHSIALRDPILNYPSLQNSGMAKKLSVLIDIAESHTFLSLELAKSAGICNLRLRLQAGKVPPVAAISQFKDRCEDFGLNLNSAVLVFPGCDYSTVETARETVGFTNLRTLADRSKKFEIAASNLGKAGVRLLTTHFGEVSANGDNFEQAVVIGNYLKRVCRENGVRLALETGQEDPVRLALLLARVKGGEDLTVGANFDTANFYSYRTGELHSALRILKPFILGVDLKDTFQGKGNGGITPGVSLGSANGVVPLSEALKGLSGLDCPFLIEQGFGDTEEKQRAAIHTALKYIDSTLR